MCPLSTKVTSYLQRRSRSPRVIYVQLSPTPILCYSMQRSTMASGQTMMRNNILAHWHLRGSHSNSKRQTCHQVWRDKSRKKTNIVLPSYLWTAGCCVHSNDVVLGPFAFIGNNDQNTRVIQMSHVTVHVIQQFLLLGWRSNCPFDPRKPRVFL